MYMYIHMSGWEGGKPKKRVWHAKKNEPDMPKKRV